MKTLSRLLILLLLWLPLRAADAFRVTLTVTPEQTGTTSGSLDSHPIDAATDGLYGVMQMSEDATITTILVHHNTTTGDPPPYKICLYSIGTDGLRSACLAAAVYDPPTGTGNNNTIRALTISHDGAGGSISSYSATKGTVYAIAVDPCPNATAPCSGASTPDGSNFTSFSYGWAGSTVRPGFPYAVTITAGTHAKITNRGMVGFGLRSATTSYGNPIQSINTVQISSGDEQGVSLTVPSGWCSTYKLVGIQAMVGLGATGKTINLNLYSGTTVLQGVALDSDAQSNASAGATSRWYWDDTPSTLTCGSTYRVGFAPQDATTNFVLTSIVLAAAGDRTAYPGGTIVTYSTRTACGGPCDGGSTAWSDSTTIRPFIDFILADITPPAGGSGGAFTFVQ